MASDIDNAATVALQNLDSVKTAVQHMADIANGATAAAAQTVTASKALLDQANAKIADQASQLSIANATIADLQAKLAAAQSGGSGTGSPQNPGPSKDYTVAKAGQSIVLADAAHSLLTMGTDGHIQIGASKPPVIDPNSSGIDFILNVGPNVYQSILPRQPDFPAGGWWRGAVQGQQIIWETQQVSDPRPPATSGTRAIPTVLSKMFDVELAGPFIGDAAGAQPKFYDDMADAELDALKKSGVTGFRVFVWMNFDNWWTAGATLDFTKGPWPGLVAFAKNKLKPRGMALVVGWNDQNKSYNDPTKITALAKQWGQCAAWLKAQGCDPALVYPEPFNEPTPGTPQIEQSNERIVFDAIRTGWPEATIICGSSNWDDLEMAITVPPHLDSGGVPLPRQIQSVHYYKSMGFTHQQLSWMNPQSYFNAGVRNYPGFENMNRAAIKGDFDRLAAYADKWKIPVLLAEFGANFHAPSPDRENWIGDIRQEAEAHGFGWSYWSWHKDPFFVCTGALGSRVTAPVYKMALGLT